jgi:hypothetical protein
VNFVFRVGLPHGSLGWKSGDLFRDAVECRAQIALCFRICALHANEITRPDPLIQVYYVRVVNLDIEAGKWGNLRDQCGDYFDGSLKNNTKVGGSGSSPATKRHDFLPRKLRFAAIAFAHSIAASPIVREIRLRVGRRLTCRAMPVQVVAGPRCIVTGAWPKARPPSPVVLRQILPPTFRTGSNAGRCNGWTA